MHNLDYCNVILGGTSAENISVKNHMTLQATDIRSPPYVTAVLEGLV